jgi:hypothetical protein
MRSVDSMRWPYALVFWGLIISAGMASTSAHAQYRNNAVQLPSVGYMAMWTADQPIKLLLTNLNVGNDTDWQWNSSDHITLGTGYSRALGYNLWYEVQAAVGFGAATYPPSGVNFPQVHPLVSLSTSTGLRYNFMDEDYRPFVAGHINYLWLYNTQGPSGESLGIQTNELLGGQSMWVGIRTGAGFEWFFMASLRGWGMDIPLFYDEMSAQLEADTLFFVSLSQNPINPSGTVRLSYNIYF